MMTSVVPALDSVGSYEAFMGFCCEEVRGSELF